MREPSGEELKMNFNLTPEMEQHLQAAKQLASNRLLRPNFFAGVAGVGIGKKVVDGVDTESWCIRIYVQSKLEIDDVPPAFLLPTSFLDVPTDVVSIGRFGRTGPVPRNANPPATGPGSSIRIASSASNVNSGAIGTYGALVADMSNGHSHYILSCNHILAVNGRVKTDREAKILPADAPAHHKAMARPYVHRPLKRNEDNQVDCALAITEEGAGGQAYARPIAPTRGAKVTKTGAVTGKTYGSIVDIDADFYVDYSFGTFRFTNQVVIDGESNKNENDVFATDGDSGSIVFTDTDQDEMQAVAMVFAEAGRFAVACRLTAVLEELEQEARLAGGSLALVVNHANRPKAIAVAEQVAPAEKIAQAS
jgi:hypothetical protein